MTRISQILAVVGGVKSDLDSQMTQILHLVTQPELVSGLEKTYRPLAEPVPGEPPPLQRPSQSKRVQVTVADALDKAFALQARQLDVTRTLDEAKTQASANVVVDGEVILESVTTDHLIYLEGQIASIFGFVQKIPVLDPSENWSDEGTEPGQYRTPPIETTSNDTVYFNHVLQKAEVIDGVLVEPQVQVMKRDEVVGKWTTTKFSGAIPAAEKRRMLTRVTKLRDAVKFAREEANMTEVRDVREGERVMAFIRG